MIVAPTAEADAAGGGGAGAAALQAATERATALEVSNQLIK